MLEITKQADYALRAVVDVARSQSNERIPTADIAARQSIPLPFLAKIISQLVVRGILTSTRGANGGVSLARTADQISMLDIIEAIDGPVLLNRCTLDPQACELRSTCSICEVFQDAQNMLVSRLGAISLAELADRKDTLAARQAAVV